jgi:hypothetical protein
MARAVSMRPEPEMRAVSAAPASPEAVRTSSSIAPEPPRATTTSGSTRSISSATADGRSPVLGTRRIGPSVRTPPAMASATMSARAM